MKKQKFSTIAEKNRIIDSILYAIMLRNKFLLLGHQNPDEDCIASLVSFALLLRKFDKTAVICVGNEIHEHYGYLLSICRYNSISFHFSGDKFEKSDFDTIVICDTPKLSMIDGCEGVQELFKDKDVVKIEIDHHIGADSEYIGDPGYCLVNEASSACELIGLLCLKLMKRAEILKRYQIPEVFSRNLVLSILTGIIGDSKMGQFLKSRREKKYYEIFSNLYSNLLAKKTVKATNFSDKTEVFEELGRLSHREGNCFNYMMGKKRFSKSIGYVALNEKDMEQLCREECESDTIVTVSRAVADILAEESGILSMVAYYDKPDHSNLVQFRIRRSAQYKNFDLRLLLNLFAIENGGGHQGAIGFRIPKDNIEDFEAYITRLISGIEGAIAPRG
ncbi:MAG: DHH family phosphoesterase [Spirochaetota bacterium]